MTVKKIPYELELRQELPEIIGNHDYQEFKNQLFSIETLISEMELDEIIIDYVVKQKQEEQKEKAKKSKKTNPELSKSAQIKTAKKCRVALRCVIVRKLLEETYRGMSCRLADSPLLQHFCLLNIFDTKVKIPSKSELKRYEQLVPEEVVREAVIRMIERGITASEQINLSEPLTLEEIYYDTTCVLTNIHFPVDWVLLRDAVRTLIKAVILVRKSGLKNRMNDPKEFIKSMNNLSIKMTNCRRIKKAKKKRKAILRLMKKLTKKVEQHARKHLELLENYWSETNLTEGRTNQIIVRIKKILKNVPAAIKQAHERIIGERHVKNKEKLLSLYETDTNVIVRGKASAEVEFGNKLILGEINCGLIVDWELMREGSPADTKLIKKGLDRIEKNYDGIATVKKVVGDRGFPSKEIENYLADKNIENYICPRSVLELRKQLKNEAFCYYQNRRSQTEGRIGILKNNFFGTALRSKGFESRELHVAWGILVHNLWVLARLPKSVALKEAA